MGQKLYLEGKWVSKFFFWYFGKWVVGGKDLNFYLGPQTPFTNKNASKEEKMFGKAP